MNQIENMKYMASDIPEIVKMHHYSGDFRAEIADIDRFLKRDIPDILRKRLELQRLTAQCLLSDYELTDGDFVRILNERQESRKIVLSDLDEICSFQNVDYIIVNGSRRWQYQASSNLLGQHWDFFEKVSPPASFDNSVLEAMAEKGTVSCRFRCRESLTLNEDAVREGELLRVWLPFPVANETQPASSIKLLSSSHPCTVTGDVLRTAFFELPAHRGDTYSVEFEYVNTAVYRDPAAVRSSEATFEDIRATLDPALYEEYTSEQYPQIVFSPFIKGLAREITAGLTKPGEMAYAIYEWITSHIQYSYIRDYLLIPNIPEFVAINGYGDCGAMILLFIALCRASGIPARWQSGNGVRPNHMGSHDWCRYYIPGSGWLYCDLSQGVGAYRSGNTYKHQHLFANIDCFRMVAADGFLVDLTPSKKLVRMDPYDNQNGEAEYADGSKNIFFLDCITHKECVECEILR